MITKHPGVLVAHGVNLFLVHVTCRLRSDEALLGALLGVLFTLGSGYCDFRYFGSSVQKWHIIAHILLSMVSHMGKPEVIRQA